ncbi:MAG: lycopene beta-cyclase CrtY [Altererythrobacter sp.]|nr:lycopene beta-cyclase CrtY [Altererythrobacter sp.]
MNGRETDVAIVGGGLAGGLIALALHRAHPEMRFQLIEAGAALGGHHRWSWFDSDLPEGGHALLAGFAKTEWNDGYEVAFPAYRRALAAGYRSLASSDFDAGLRAVLPASALRLGSKVSALDVGGVTLESGDRIAAQAVIDCRSVLPSQHLQGGWQIFTGRHFKYGRPHGLSQPMIMDASIAQHAPSGNRSAYRFMYLLPLAKDELFFEDTYYDETRALDEDLLGRRIDQYAADMGFRDGVEIGREKGVLPVITGGNFDAYRASIDIPGVAMAGARGGFSHPLTSYTMPIAVENALAIASHAHLSGPLLAHFVRERANEHWRKTSIYRALGRMLFKAAEPERRVDIFQRFYRLPEDLIERFYACRTTLPDKLRILSGKPPVSIPRAIRALASKGDPLIMENTE